MKISHTVGCVREKLVGSTVKELPQTEELVMGSLVEDEINQLEKRPEDHPKKGSSYGFGSQVRTMSWEVYVGRCDVCHAVVGLDSSIKIAQGPRVEEACWEKPIIFSSNDAGLAREEGEFSLAEGQPKIMVEEEDLDGSIQPEVGFSPVETEDVIHNREASDRDHCSPCNLKKDSLIVEEEPLRYEENAIVLLSSLIFFGRTPSNESVCQGRWMSRISHNHWLLSAWGILSIEHRKKKLPPVKPWKLRNGYQKIGV